MGLFLLVASPAFAEPSDATITSKPVGAFEHSQQDRTSFGRLDYVGGLVLRSTNQHFGALSGLVVQPDGAMLAVTDTGFWVTAQIKRDADRRPQSLSNARVGPLLDERGQAFEHKWDADAEALTLRNNRA
ncbi:MAG: esterase-like activity of phytase family protein, partial [Pseudomonadota bacterium]